MPSIRISLFALLMLVGCYGTSEMQGADTNTNWLKPCETTAQCGGSLTCIDALCSVECVTATACHHLAPDAVCVNNACRPAPEDEEPVSDASANEASANEDVDASDSDPDLSIDAGAPSAVFDENGYITLSSVDRQASRPRVIWSGDRFLVAWASATSYDRETGEPTSGPPAVEVVEVDATSVIATYSVEVEDFADIAGHIESINDAGEVVRAVQHDECNTRIVNYKTGAVREIDVLCDYDATLRVASVRGSDEWLIATGVEREISVGRYGTAAGWLAPLEVIGEADRAGPALDLATAGGSATVAWGDEYGSTAFMIDDLDALAVGSALRFDGALLPDSGYGLAQLDDRVLAVGPFTGNMWSSVLRADQAPTLSDLQMSEVKSHTPGTAWIEEQQVLAVCVSTGDDNLADMDGVYAILVDRDGNIVESAGGRVVETDMWAGGGCDLAWSGSELLIAWWHIDQASEQRTSVVRALRLPVPWS